MVDKTVLFIVACLSACGAIAAESPTWLPYIQLQGSASNSRELGQGDLFVPLWQDDCQLIFADMRGHWSSHDAAEGNWGLASRSIVAGDKIVGVYGFFDVLRSSHNNVFYQGTAGAELLGEQWGLRVNGYVPERGAQAVPSLTDVLVSNTGNIFVRPGLEAAFWGVDFEGEQLLWRRAGCSRVGDLPCSANRFAADAEVWGAVGLFHFENNIAGFEALTGSRFRAEVRLYDLPLLGDDSRLVLSGQYAYDNVRGSVGTGMLTVRVPFGRRQGRRLAGIERRMVAPVVRDVDVVSRTGFGNPEPAKFARTNQMISRVVTIDAGTPNPESVVKSAGTDSVVTVDGSAGTIRPLSPIELNAGQALLGGGSALTVVGAETGVVAVYRAPGQRPLIESTASGTVLASESNTIRGLHLQSLGLSADVITLEGAEDVLFDDLTIATFGDGASGIFSRDASEFTLSRSSISTSGRFANGITSFRSKRFSVQDSNLTTTGFRASGIHALNDNVFTVDGGQIEALGASARGVTVSAEILGGTSPTSTFVLHGVTINSAGIGVFLDSDPTVIGTPTNSTINATLTNNSISSGPGFDTVEAVTYGTATVNLNASNNVLDAGSGTVQVNRTSIGSRIRVTQGAPGAGANSINSQNGIPSSSILVTGNPVDFNALPPVLP